jgi:hypothetical protein
MIVKFPKAEEEEEEEELAFSREEDCFLFLAYIYYPL